ncbi:MAG: SagB/ThcOx family dehydrogenase [Rikenellaceae bacterium]|nr:SagB/ThcOx family dehydrogenase [Rikenellaceae bacterium]
MKKLFFVSLIAILAYGSYGQELSAVKLNAPDLETGAGIMQALAKRESIRQFSDKELTLQNLSDLLWAANGINRPESGKRTAPSAGNRQALDIYLCNADGVYRYDAVNHAPEPVNAGDYRQFDAPVYLVIVANTDHKESFWTDAGVISQNISLFCAGRGLGTVCRGGMDHDKLREGLKLKEDQHLMLNHPVGYPK